MYENLALGKASLSGRPINEKMAMPFNKDKRWRLIN
jgi:hypothetical protein